MKDAFHTREMLRLTLLNYILCFVLLTLSEVVFSLLYLLVTGRIDAFIYVGAVLYALGIMTTYSGYKAAKYKLMTSEMLDAFLSTTG